MKTRAPALALIAAVLLSGCATVGQDRLAERDPLEKFNRGVWGLNNALDKVAIRPVTKVYRAVAPRPVRQGVTNAFANLTEPWSFVNNLLQGKPKRALRTLARFVVNTTVGIGGLFDRASKMGIAPAREDFGQTLAKWGVNGGPYLVLPILGPSTLRDGIGSGVAFGADPFVIALNNSGLSTTERYGVRAAQVISARSDLMETGGDAFLNSSLDSYAAARSAYLQSRRAAILDQENGGGATDDAIVPTQSDGADEPIVPTSSDGAPADDAVVPTAADAADPATTPAPAPAGESVPTPIGGVSNSPPPPAAATPAVPPR